MVRSGVFLLLLALLIPAATAATITITPVAIDPGDTVTVDVQNLPDGADFSLEIRGEFDVTPGDRFAFTAQNLVLPFSLSPGEVSAYSKGTEWTGLSVQMPDGVSASLSNNADANGEFCTTESRNISSGTYAAVTLDGRAASAARNIITKVTMQGTKRGPDNGKITFGIGGITHGTATVTVYVDGSQALSRVIAIGSPSPSSTGTTSGPSGPGSSLITDPIPGPATASSADGKAALTGTDIEGAGLLAITVQGTLPAGWALEGKTYAVTPEGREFDSNAVLSFRLPSPDTAATLARFENGIWTPVPSKIEGDRITATISRAGTYTLFVPATASGSTGTAATTALPVTATVTTISSVTTTPATTPVTPLLPVIALAMLILGWSRRE